MKRLIPTLLYLCLPFFLVAQGKTYKQLKYRFIGPDGNRAISVVGEPGNPLVMYVGAASGGLFKTEDGGNRWRPIFDDQDVSSVSALAMAPSNPQQIWAGTGETFLIRPAHAIGDGIYKSTDGGKTWKNMGLASTYRIARIVVHPHNQDIVWVAAMGHSFGPQKERGIYKTMDGGKTWKQVLFVDENTGGADIAINPKNPDELIAATWQLHINTWGLNSGGKGSGVFHTTDGGDTWKAMSENGLPGGEKDPNAGKIAVAISPSHPNIFYALMEQDHTSLYRSTDSGKTWEKRSTNHTMAERASYYTRIGLDIEDPDRIYFLSVRFAMSEDGGKTLSRRPPRGGGDTHDIWMDPLNPDRFMVADDAGATFTLNHGKTFKRITLPIAQMYHVAVDNQIPYNVYGNRQDGYSYRGPSNTQARGIPLGKWQYVGGCECGFAQPDPVDNNIVWSGCYDGGLQVYDEKSQQIRDVRVFPEAGYGVTPKDMKYRWHWNFPLHISPHDHNKVYVGSQYVHQTTSKGQKWAEISPDLTLDLESHQQNSGGVAIDNLMTFDGSVIFAIAESPVQKDLIWVGTNDGQIQLTKDGGKTWDNLTKNIKDFPEWGTVANIEPSKYDAGTAYFSYDMHQMADFKPYIYKTTDYGQTWTKISASIPESSSSFVHVIKQDYQQKDLLFAGTDNHLYFSPNDGKDWHSLRNNMPPAPVYWLEIQEHFDDLVVATYGRGFYILDDISALRQMSADIAAKEVHLFKPRNAYRFNQKAHIHAESGSNVWGRNPSNGALINYHLKDTTAKSVTLEIVDKNGDLIRTIKGKNEAGVNRLVWDFRYAPTTVPVLRNAPPNMPWVPLNDKGERILYAWDLDLNGGKRGPRAIPGEYTLRLKAKGQTLTEKLVVLKDPSGEGTETDIAAQVDLSLNLYEMINQTVDMINNIEWMRQDIQSLKGADLKSSITTKITNLEKQLIQVESELYDINLTGAREDAFRNPNKLYGRILALAHELGTASADYPPTDQQAAVAKILNGRLTKQSQLYRSLLTKEVGDINRLLKKAKSAVQIKERKKTGGA
ncbi:MAG: glycosyl hydrolase [Saprospiraceae bacterium]